MNDSERGGAVNVQMALLWPVLLLLVVTVVQVALVYYAGQLALSAAQDGLRAGRYYGTSGSPEQARAAAEGFLTHASGSVLTTPSVTAELADDDATLRVRVTGQVLSLVPGITPSVDKHATGALEQVTP